MARNLGPALLGRPLDGVWHTAIVVYGKEYFFGGGGIEWCRPGGTMMGSPLEAKDLGETQISEDLFQDYLRTQSEDRFRGDRYDLFRHNCNNFSNETAQFLVGRGIPQYILDLPNEILSTPMGQMLAPMIQQMTPSGTSIPFTQSGNTSAVAQSSSSNTQGPSLKFPVTELVAFDQGLKVEGISKKLDEINSSQTSDDTKLAEADLKIILGIAKGLVRLSDENFDILMKILRWKKSEIFPLLDILRFKLVKNSFENEKQVEKVVSVFCDNLSADHQVNAMLSVRGLCNLIGSRWSALMNTNTLNDIVGLLPTSHQNLETAITTFIYNSSVKLVEKKDLDSSIFLASTLVLQVLPSIKESEYRSLLALGNILKTGSEEVTQFLLSLETEQIVRQLQLRDERSSDCVKEIRKLLETKGGNSNGLDLD